MSGLGSEHEGKSGCGINWSSPLWYTKTSLWIDTGERRRFTSADKERSRTGSIGPSGDSSSEQAESWIIVEQPHQRSKDFVQRMGLITDQR